MKEIALPQNKFALVDDEDFERVNQYRWNINSSGYAQHDFGQRRGIRKIVSMHRFIMGNPEGREIDHANHGKLDNRKCNLRVVKRNQNQWNRGVQKNSISGVKGVNRTRYGRFMVRIMCMKKKHHLGTFATIEEASAAYREAAVRLHGEFARA